MKALKTNILTSIKSFFLEKAWPTLIWACSSLKWACTMKPSKFSTKKNITQALLVLLLAPSGREMPLLKRAWPGLMIAEGVSQNIACGAAVQTKVCLPKNYSRYEKSF